MDKKLIIAEKPSLAMHIVTAIGKMNKADGYFENDEYIVTFAFGHLFGLKNIDDYLHRQKTAWSLDELPFIPERFEYQLKHDPGVKRQYEIIKKLYKRTDIDFVINAGDPDREGSVIILNILSELEKETSIKKSAKRIWLKATTPDYVRQALKELHDEEYYGNLYEEGLARTYVDWLYGINYTRFVSLKANSFLPIGRVLIPILKFVYDRDQEIANFKIENYFEIEGTFNKEGEEIKCRVKGLKYEANEKALGLHKLEELRYEKAIVSSVVTKDVVKKPPKLFSLDTLQNKLSKEFKYSPNETLEIVQQLYESGFVTYPRTNTEYMSSAEKDSVHNLINEISLSDKITLKIREDKGIFDDAKIEGHTALIITNKFPDLNLLTEKEKNAYQCIKNRLISNFLDDETIIQETNITIIIGNNTIELTGSTIKQMGFYKYEKVPNEKYLPIFNKNEIINLVFELVEKHTTPPNKVTEVEINEFLKSPFKSKEIKFASDNEEYRLLMSGCEIGTVATRASIIENAYKYEYIKKEKSSITCTKKGLQLIELLVNLDIDMSKEKTVEMGMFLKNIFKREANKESLIQLVSDEISNIMSSKKETHITKIEKEGLCKCPKCKDGNILEGTKAYYCSNYKDGCDFSIWKEVAGKKLTKSQLLQLIEKRKTSKISGFIGKKGKFDAILVLTNNYSLDFEFPKRKSLNRTK